MTISNNGTYYLKTFNEPGCTEENKASVSSVKFDCDNNINNVGGFNIQCRPAQMGVFYTLSSDKCPSIKGELNKCISFEEETCGYKSARFSSSNGDSPNFAGYSNSYCGSNDDGDVISSFGVSCIKSAESKAYDLECNDSSAATLVFSSSLLLFVILFALL
ncbi:expressed protein [Dictyostelium purpureum]|uniref:Expressed protein n=1 Tax=Dictyostelium purpureum TaxID=5786 RepID=F0ZP86_DICPU|nr:uncharacterized protein DICPUDRAFT_92262 [Dictyostelium purpureum]EGC34262.1 expressed protein [Dictyostelium purpureum]|eukprot:XP_003289231.1 expressed protein [Dictyostelium purpureum]